MRTKQIIKKAAIAAVIAAVCSCSSLYSFKINVLKPALVQVQPNIKNVIIINHGYIKNACSITDLDGAIVDNFDSTLSMQYINALNDFLNNSPRFQVLKVYSAPRRVKEKNSDALLKMADSLCIVDKADAAIILDNTSISKVLFNSEHSRVKSKMSTEGYCLSLSIRANWKIYSAVNHSIIDKHNMKDSSNYYISTSNLDYAKEEFPKMWEQFYNSGYRLGNQYGRRIAQEWVSETRYIYSYPNNDFDQALKYVKNNEWVKAIQLWEPYINSDKTKMASVAAYNIAVASEVNDDLDNALNYAAKSYFLEKLPQTEAYISSLEKRVKDKISITKQLTER